MCIKAINIIWDVDSEEELKDLPTEIEVPEGMIDEEEISDYISDMTGYCHKGFKVSYENEQTVSKTINKTICPYCGKKLIRLEPYEEGIYEFWCDDCDLDIMMTDNNYHNDEFVGLWNLEELKRDYHRWENELKKLEKESDVYEEDIAMIRKILSDYEEILF